MNKNAFYQLSYGVYVVTTWKEGKPTGCIANSAMQVTSEPATIAISINHDNYTNHCIKDSNQFAVSILSEQAEPSLIGQFGFQSGKDVDKFEGVEYEVKGNMPVLKEGCGFITCKVIDTMETATHTIFLGEVTDADIRNQEEPMTYRYYHQVIKGKSPKNAPTYIAE